MIKVYHDDAELRAVTGVWVFDTKAESAATVSAYQDAGYNFTVEEDGKEIYKWQ